jgi:WD40 repeat protein
VRFLTLFHIPSVVFVVVWLMGNNKNPQEMPSPESEGPSFSLVAAEEKAHDCDVNCVAWNPVHPNILATAGDDQHIKIWSYTD